MRTPTLIFLAVAFLAAAPGSAPGSTFTNPTRIAIPGGTPPPGAGPASPYPSVISVSGLPATVVKARATLTGISHEDSGVDIDVLLVGPGGQKTILMSDACSALQSPLDLTFDDAAGAQLPQLSGCSSGTWRPTDYAGIAEAFAAPAPAGPYQAALSGFNGTIPNGAWQLFVVDDAGPDSDASSIAGGWTLELLPQATCNGKVATLAANVGTAGADRLVGTPGSDVMLGLGGKDRLMGRGGNDVICGGAGADKLKAGAGRDVLLGQGGRDELSGERGSDVCRGGARPDSARSCEKRRSI